MKFSEFIKEDKQTDDFIKWKEAVKKANPQYASKMKFVGRVERLPTKHIISAEVPGLDRCFGVWDQDKETGELLGENSEKNYQDAYAEMVDDDEKPLSRQALETKLKSVAQKFKLNLNQAAKLRKACKGPMGCPTGPVKESLLTEGVNHGAVVKFIHDLAIKCVKVDSGVEKDFLHWVKYEAENDRFWSSTIDGVTKVLDDFIAGDEESEDNVIDEIDQALDEVGNNIVSHYSNPMNHEPGYKKPKGLKFDAETVSTKEIFDMLEKLFPAIAKIRKEAAARRKKEEAAERKAEVAAVTPELLKKMAADIDLYWDKTISKDAVKMIQRYPKDFTDWFSDPTKITTPELLLKGIKGGGLGREAHIIEWIIDGMPIKKTPNAYYTVYRSKAMLAKLIPLVTRFKK